MSHEVQIKRTIHVAECPTCHDRTELDSNPPRELLCNVCKVWVPYVEVSYTGKDLK